MPFGYETFSKRAQNMTLYVHLGHTRLSSRYHGWTASVSVPPRHLKCAAQAIDVSHVNGDIMSPMYS